jgi:hypothetical protein
MLREASTRTAPRRTALRFDDGAPGPWQRAMLTPSGSQTWRPTLADWQWEPWPRPQGAPSPPHCNRNEKMRGISGRGLN